MRRIRTGISRTVFLVGNHAVKVPSGRGHCSGGARGFLAGIAAGILANQSEYQWHNFQGWDGKVCPVTHSWFGGLVQVYPRCQPLPEDTPDELLFELDPDPGDHKADNYGLLAGRIVRLDYDMR